MIEQVGRTSCALQITTDKKGFALPALAAVVADNWRFGRAVDNGDDGSPSQSVSRPCHNVFFVLVVPARLRHLCCRPPPAKTPFPKSVEDDLQEIARIPPRFRISVFVILVTMPLPSLPSQSSHSRPMNNVQMSIAGIGVATIKLRRKPSTRWRRESSRRRRGSVPLHPSHSSSSVASASADAVADAVRSES
jgi:hypothetical protein